MGLLKEESIKRTQDRPERGEADGFSRVKKTD